MTRQQLSLRAAAAVESLVKGFDGWYDHDAITAMTNQIVTVVEAAQRQTANVTEAYLQRVASEVFVGSVRPSGPIDPATLRQGVTHAGAYGRLADQYRFQASIGAAPALIKQAVLSRATSMAKTDLDLAFRAQSKNFMVKNRVDGYRRIIRPERAVSGTCGMCIAASDRMYFRGDLLPIHGGCGCGVLPIKNGKDPGVAVNREDLDRLYDDAGSTAAKDLINTRYVINEHGEIGPVLGREGDSFRGPTDIP
ncbi:hypothetical protein [Arthrobacter alpinus]|uniref:hypothetical protein n=1 Tax=Arthrobacter alpinus TaxID=656366 RepID=UPI0011149F74|nr:hypothetical protein [Arthrobacter alpinus]